MNAREKSPARLPWLAAAGITVILLALSSVGQAVSNGGLDSLLPPPPAPTSSSATPDTPQWVKVEFVPRAPFYIANWKGKYWTYVAGPVGVLPLSDLALSGDFQQVLRVHLQPEYLDPDSFSRQTTESGGTYRSYLTSKGRALVESLLAQLIDVSTFSSSDAGKTLAKLQPKLLGEDPVHDEVDVALNYPWGYLELGVLANYYGRAGSFPSNYEKVFFGDRFQPPVMVDDGVGHSMREAFIQTPQYNFVDYVWGYPMFRLAMPTQPLPPPSGTEDVVSPPSPPVLPANPAGEEPAEEKGSESGGPMVSVPPGEHPIVIDGGR